MKWIYISMNIHFIPFSVFQIEHGETMTSSPEYLQSILAVTLKFVEILHIFKEWNHPMFNSRSASSQFPFFYLQFETISSFNGHVSATLRNANSIHAGCSILSSECLNFWNVLVTLVAVADDVSDHPQQLQYVIEGGRYYLLFISKGC